VAARSIEIKLELRKETGKNKAKKLRKEGYLPAIFYGPGYKESIPVMVRIDDVLPYLQSSHWGTYAFNVTLPDGRTETALIRDLQVDPLSREILHVDFYQLLKGHKVLVAVPVVLENRDDCIGVKKGGVLVQPLYEIEMEVLPGEIPDGIHVDVAALDIGDSVRMSDIELPESAVISIDPEETIVQVVEPIIEEIEEAVEEEVEEEMEVEVIGKKGVVEEEEEEEEE